MVSFLRIAGTLHTLRSSGYVSFALFVGLLVLPMPVRSQEAEVSRSFEALQEISSLEQGDAIRVVNRDGTTLEGRLDSLSVNSLNLVVDGTSRQLPGGSVQRISRRDSTRNGLMIGMGVGTLVGLVLTKACLDESGPEAVCGPAFIIGLAGGAAAGWGIDRSLHGYDTVYEAPVQAQNQRFTISPIVSEQQQGVRIAFSF